MIRIIIVEDREEDAAALELQLGEYARNVKKEFDIIKYDDPLGFLSEKKMEADVIFLDIDMPNMSGMELAHKIREIDSTVIIVFVTNMLQYALDGYSVSALDFLIKPVNYQSVLRVMNKVLETLANREDKVIAVKSSVDGRIVVINAADIYYVEVNRHRIVFHTKQGEIADWGSLDSVQDKLPAKTFSRCHVSFLVNLKYVGQIKKDEVFVGEDSLPISRSQKKNFCADLAKFLSKGW